MNKITLLAGVALIGLSSLVSAQENFGGSTTHIVREVADTVITNTGPVTFTIDNISVFYSSVSGLTSNYFKAMRVRGTVTNTFYASAHTDGTDWIKFMSGNIQIEPLDEIVLRNSLADMTNSVTIDRKF